MSLGRQLRYRFDNVMARGVFAQVLLLAIVTLLLVAISVGLVFALDVVPESGDGDEKSFTTLRKCPTRSSARRGW